MTDEEWTPAIEAAITRYWRIRERRAKDNFRLVMDATEAELRKLLEEPDPLAAIEQATAGLL